MRRAGVGGALAAGSVALVAAAVFFGHGTSDARLFWFGIAALALTAVGWILRPAVLRGAAISFFGLLGALVVWQAVSIHWSIQPAASWDYANRGLVYLAFACVGALLTGFARERIVEAIAALLGALFVVALLAKVAADIYPDYGRLARLRWPLGYWNELALLAAAAVPVALWLSARRRVLGSLLLYAALVTVVLTFSRFGIVLAIVAAVVWLVLERDRLDSFPSLVAAVPPAAVVAGICFALPGITKDGESHSTRVRDGLILLALLVVGALVVALASRWAPAVALRRRLAVQAAIVLVLVCIAAIVALVVRAGGPIAFVQHRWHEFSRTQSIPSAARLGSASSGNRWQWWQQSWRAFLDHPGGGTGAGTFALTSTVDAHNSLQTTIEPHNTPLQFLTETGIVGFLLYAGMIAALFVGLRRGLRDRATLALAFVLAIVVVHSILDVDWDFVCTQGLFFAVGGYFVARPAAARRLRLLPATAVAACCLAAIYSLFAPWLSNRRLNDAYNALGAGHSATAYSDAKDAHSLNPLSVEPLYVLAGLDGNVRWMHEAVHREPRNPETWYELAVFEYENAGDARAAYAAASRSYRIDRYGPAGQPHNVGILAACKLHLRTSGC